LARTKKNKRKTKRTAKSTRTTVRRRRTKKEQQQLVREIFSVFFFTFGLASLVVMYKTEGETGFALRSFLVGMFGKGGWFVSIASFFIGVQLLFPARIWERYSRIAWAGGIAWALLGLLELPLIAAKTPFALETTHGGRLGYALSKTVSFFLGSFLTGVLEIALILTGIMILTNLSLESLAERLSAFLTAASERLQEAFASLRNAAIERQQQQTPPKSRSRTYEEPEPDDTPPPEPFPLREDYREVAFSQKRIERAEPHLEPEVRTPSPATPTKSSVWFLPPLDLLDPLPREQAAQGDPEKRARIIENTLLSFGVETKVVEINTGPTITQYALEPAVGVKVSKITSLQNDLALALATPQIRLEAPIPGKPYVGIEVPNYNAATVTLRGLLQTSEFQKSKHIMPLALGKNVSGDVFFADLVKMPHLLIAGATGSGKSVCINSVIGSVLYKYNPGQVKFIMVDPKVVELSRYNGIPHLLSKVITKPQKMISSLKWTINEMERRYKVFGASGARNIEIYNAKQVDELTKLPYIIVLVDELADLILASPVEVEELICRLAQKARATGIHLVLATQRPSVDVVTGLIKANIPARICFAVASQIDSRVVLDAMGAEKLLGKGDMLYHAPDVSKMIRLQGVFVSDAEVERLVQFWSGQGTPEYLEEIINQPVGIPTRQDNEEYEDDLLPAALEEVVREGRGSASLLQRRLRIGYARAARLIDILEMQGVLSPADGSKPREILRTSLPRSAPAAFPDEEPAPTDQSLFDEYR